MKDLNCVQLIGHLGADPSVIYTDVGTARTTFSVATSRHWIDADGKAQTETEWTRCITWGKLAEIAAQFAHKGSRVYVTGRLHTSHWDDGQSGVPRSSIEIILDDLILLDRRTPAVAAENEPDVGETQPTPNTPAPASHSTTQQPIRRPRQPVQARDTSHHPSKLRRTDR